VESGKRQEKSAAAKDEPFRLPQRPEKMETTAHVRLMTLDNQPAIVHVGSRVPRVAGLSVSSSGGETRSTTLDNVGLTVGITPRIDPDGAVVMQIDVEQAQPGPENESAPLSADRRNVVRSPRIDATTVQTIVRILDAQALVLAGVAQKGKADKDLVIIVTPHIMRPEAAKKVR
jgi:type II secretory pathway component GspD/PulD (secretin)